MFIRYYEDQYLYRAPRYSITINTAARKMTLFRDGKVFKTYPIAIGKPSTPTPKGNFKIINKAYNPGGPFGARWLGLSAPNGDYGFTELTILLPLAKLFQMDV